MGFYFQIESDAILSKRRKSTNTFVYTSIALIII